MKDDDRMTFSIPRKKKLVSVSGNRPANAYKAPQLDIFNYICDEMTNGSTSVGSCAFALAGAPIENASKPNLLDRHAKRRCEDIHVMCVKDVKNLFRRSEILQRTWIE